MSGRAAAGRKHEFPFAAAHEPGSTAAVGDGLTGNAAAHAVRAGTGAQQADAGADLTAAP